MTQRVNYISRYMPNEYGNSMGTNIPITPESTQWMKNKELAKGLESSITNLDQQASAADSNIIKPKDALSNGDLAAGVAGDTLSSAGGAIALAKKSIGAGASEAKGKAGFSAKGAGAAAAGTAVAGIAGNALDKKGHEVAGGALSGAASGASMGMSLGPWGAAVGAVVGGVAGAIGGKKKQNDRLDAEKEVEDWNTKMSKLKSKSLTQADDLRAYQGILSGSKGTQILYRSGGILKYESINVKESLDYVNSLLIEQHKSGGQLKDKSITSFTPSKEELKTTPITLKVKEIPLLRRGGPVDIQKENVIIDGPSHDEENNTGVKGDRGLPVVKDGKKIAEIESLELVLNSKSSNKLDSLIKEFNKTKDIKIKEQIGELLSYELGHNTYDYSNLLK